MTKVYGLFLLFTGFLSLMWGEFLLVNSPQVETPEPGDVLQGVIVIVGSTKLSGFQSAEISFSYNSDDADERFLIHSSTEPISTGTLAVWDTTTISDGTYRLHIIVHLEDDRQVETVVPDLRVRNYTPVETGTPNAEADPDIAVFETRNTPTNIVVATPTPFPPNQARITSEEIRNGLIQGAIFSATILIMIGIYWLFRNWSENR
ncbi:MAG: hypothetical protein MUO76_11905 [Anaerolineaceae bacterium]|nr:hypothetical protein [Anaerolineaceae bacterium]